MGDDYAYSVAVDKQGRIWVGHLNHGVSVYNGTSWRNYDVPHGPIGERVFKIAVCPTDGDVWIGTSAGLTRYSVSRDEWRNYTKGQSENHLIQNAEGRMMNDEVGQGANETGNQKSEIGNEPGLPSDQISAIAFDKAGNIYVGTQCDGIAMASRESDYTDWKQAALADQKMPTFAGYGLPSKLINDLLVTSDGTIYAATDGGLAWSRDSGATWIFRRGKDFADKMKNLCGRPRRKGGRPSPFPRICRRKIMSPVWRKTMRGVIWADFRQHGMLALSGYGYEELEKVSAEGENGRGGLWPGDFADAGFSSVAGERWQGSVARGGTPAIAA